MSERVKAQRIPIINRPSGPIIDKLLGLRESWPDQPDVIYRYCDVLASRLGYVSEDQDAGLVNQAMYLAMILAISEVTRSRDVTDQILVAMPEIIIQSCDPEFAEALNVFADVMGSAIHKMAPFMPNRPV